MPTGDTVFGILTSGEVDEESLSETTTIIGTPQRPTNVDSRSQRMPDDLFDQVCNETITPQRALRSTTVLM